MSCLIERVGHFLVQAVGMLDKHCWTSQTVPPGRAYNLKQATTVRCVGAYVRSHLLVSRVISFA